jgi:hypothetical protein
MLALGKAIGGIGLGALILWHVGVQSCARKGVAVVHVSAPNVYVRIDDVTRRVETPLHSPVVFELRPGRHKLQMIRNARVLYEEYFTLGAGQDLVLAVGDQSDDAQPRGARSSVPAENPCEAFRRGQKSP